MASFTFDKMMSRGILIFLGCGILAMLFVSLGERITNPNLVVGQRAGNDGTKNKNPGGGMNSEIPGLMQQLNENPKDVGILVHLSEHLITDGEADVAENFLKRALVEEPNHAKANYWLGVVLHGKDKNEEAVAALEKSILADDDPTVRRSLGLIYIYYLDNTKKGLEHLNAGLSNPKATAAVKKMLNEELVKAQSKAE